MRSETFLTISIFFIVVFGYGMPFLILYLLSAILTMNWGAFQINVQNNLFFFLSLILLLFFGTIDSLFYKQADSNSIITWIAFVVFPLVIFSIKDFDLFAVRFEQLIILLFIMDVCTNILLLVTPLPWASLPVIRHGELLPRFPGFKGSQLFSGYLSLITLCFLLENFSKNKKFKLLFFLALFNLLLAGSYRFFAIILVITFLKFFNVRIITRHKTHLFFILFVTFIVVSTFLTKDFSGSNYLRTLFWTDSFLRMLDVPITGNGFFILKLKDINTYETLKAAGNTESCILSMGINFGILVLFLFVIGLLSSMKKCSYYTKYLGLLIVEASLLFFGGGNTNILDGTILGISLIGLNNLNMTNFK